MPTPGTTNEGFPLFFPSLPSNEAETHSYLRKSTISHYNWFLSSSLCEEKAWDEIFCLFRYNFCFLTILTDVFVWCSGWDPTAFTWQPGNQSFMVAMVTRGGAGRRSPFYPSRLSPFLEAYRIFRQRSLWTQQQQASRQLHAGITKHPVEEGVGEQGKYHKEARGVAFSPQSSGPLASLWREVSEHQLHAELPGSL